MTAFILFVIKSFLFSAGAVFLVGLARLFYGIQYRPHKLLKDPALLKKGDILLVGKQSITYFWYLQLINVLFRRIPHRFWVHTAIYAGEGRVWEALPEGIQKNDLSKYLTGNFYIRAFRHKYIQDEKILSQLDDFCGSHQDTGYDLLGAVFYGISILIPIGFNFLLDNPDIDKFFHVKNAYFCSELVVDAFKAIDYPISPLDGWRVRPIDFITNPLLKEVG